MQNGSFLSAHLPRCAPYEVLLFCATEREMMRNSCFERDVENINIKLLRQWLISAEFTKAATEGKAFPEVKRALCLLCRLGQSKGPERPERKEDEHFLETKKVSAAEADTLHIIIFQSRKKLILQFLYCHISRTHRYRPAQIIKAQLNLITYFPCAENHRRKILHGKMRSGSELLFHSYW